MEHKHYYLAEGNDGPFEATETKRATACSA